VGLLQVCLRVDGRQLCCQQVEHGFGNAFVTTFKRAGVATKASSDASNCWTFAAVGCTGP